MSGFQSNPTLRHRSILYALGLTAACVAINLLCSAIATVSNAPLFLDSVGTIAAAILGGYLPGIVTGYLTNLINGLLGDGINAYYGTLNALIALSATILAKRGYFRKWWKIPFCVVVFTAIGGGLGSVITWFLYGMGFGEGFSAALAQRIYAAGGSSVFSAQLAADILYDLLDKLVTVLLVLLLIRLVPAGLKEKFGLFTRHGVTENASELKSVSRTMSLRVKTVLMLAAATLVIGFSATSISFILYRQATLADHAKLGQAVADLAGSVLDADKIGLYLTEGEDASGYLETERQLYHIRESSPTIKFVYVYQIRPDGCHVVFDLDTDDVPGSDPGDVIEFDESFAPYLDALLAGRPIEPLVTDDTYGWLLTAYSPVFDSRGDCVCYAATDISMEQLRTDGYGYLVRLITLFFGFFAAVLLVGLWLAEEYVVFPINAMAATAGAFAYTDDADRTATVDAIHRLNIRTGDEIENLYNSFSKTTGDMVNYIAEVQHRGKVIEKMQNGLIMVLADMVESRDKCTGDHVRKTAAYVQIIVDQMRADGYYADQLTDHFMQDVVNSAPLHDVGKIQISDALLNKPGKLTEEEFNEMKKHTVCGSEVISRAIEIVPESGYLDEAKNLAEFHHERWDGKGYPCQLKGEETPLSARIMAVADVFDALVSRRNRSPSRRRWRSFRRNPAPTSIPWSWPPSSTRRTRCAPWPGKTRTNDKSSGMSRSFFSVWGCAARHALLSCAARSSRKGQSTIPPTPKT